jgi:hypothetical protein
MVVTPDGLTLQAGAREFFRLLGGGRRPYSQ